MVLKKHNTLNEYERDLRINEKNSGLYEIWTHDLCDTSALLYQLS